MVDGHEKGSAFPLRVEGVWGLLETKGREIESVDRRILLCVRGSYYLLLFEAHRYGNMYLSQIKIICYIDSYRSNLIAVKMLRN